MAAISALCEAAVAEAAARNVCVYHENNGTDIVVNNNVYPALADVDDRGDDGAKWDAINAAWRKIETIAGAVGVEVEKADAEGGAPPCTRIRIAVARASESLKQACSNGYPTPKRPASKASDDEAKEAPAKRTASEACDNAKAKGETPPAKRPASEASEPTAATAAKRPAVTITASSFSPGRGSVYGRDPSRRPVWPFALCNFKWDPLDAPEDHRAWAEDCFEKWSREELDDLLREHANGRLGDTGSIPHHQAREYYGALNPDFDALCALFTEVCTAIAQYAAANKLRVCV
jgi:hypothetical protein